RPIDLWRELYSTWCARARAGWRSRRRHRRRRRFSSFRYGSTSGYNISVVKRYPYLDWLSGLAILIMIQCHAFNSFTRMDLREGGPYVLSQFVGGMAAPLFLFMAGMTTGFQMESLANRESDARRRWLVALKRGGYILLI